MNIGIIGLGLIGGSLAKLIRREQPNTIIHALDTNETSLKKALSDDAIHHSHTNLSSFPTSLDLVIVATPIDTTVSLVKSLLAHCEPSTLITDVASVKEPIVSQIDAPNFIGGHPMGGTENTGYIYADADILNEVPFALTPQKNNNITLEKLTEILKELKFNVLKIDAEEHDKQVAVTSHFPYLMSVLTKRATDGKNITQELIGPGFLSTTRVANSSPEWGKSVLTHNQKNITQLLNELGIKINLKKVIASL